MDYTATNEIQKLKLKLVKNEDESFIILPSAKVLYLVRFLIFFFFFLLLFFILYMVQSVTNVNNLGYAFYALSFVAVVVLTWQLALLFCSFKLSFKENEMSLHQKIFGFSFQKWNITRSKIKEIYMEESLKFPLLHIIGEEAIVIGPRFLLNQKDFYFLKQQIADYVNL